MRPFPLLVVALALGACAGGDDEGPFRPGGGGGGGGSSQGGDARLADAAGDGGGGGELNGLVCVVSDLRVPEACPTVAAQEGVPVGVVGAAATATSGADGRFTLAVTSSSVTLDAASGSAVLVRSFVPVVVSGSLVPTPVVTQVAFDATIASLGAVVPDGGGTIVAYVADGNSPAAGVAFSTVAGSSLAPFYDDGGATSWVQGGGTGAAGVALFVDVPAGTVSLDGVAADARVARATVPVVADAVTFVQIGLVAP
jgi:hypothetical protein